MIQDVLIINFVVEQVVKEILAAKDIGTFLQKTKETREEITGLGEYYKNRAEAEWDSLLQRAEEYPARYQRRGHRQRG